MSYRYIDTHAHLNISAFSEDVDEVVSKCGEEEVAVINIGTKESTSQRAVELAEQQDNLYAIVGLHPIQTTSKYHSHEEIGEGSKPFKSQGEKFNSNFYRQLAKSEKVVGIGECGFDYFHNDSGTREEQEEAFVAQIELANELGLPLMIHTRSSKDGKLDAYEDVYQVLKSYAKVPGNIHFYAGTYEQAKKFFELGFTVSFTGVITFASEYEEVVEQVPLDMIHAETDCPYVAPVPHRGKMGEPWMVKEVYKKIAAIRSEDEERVREQLLANAMRHYSL
ncbi:hypothetical protein CL653_00310 [bacterium]|nr:hypothetical protein [bacterium]